MLFPAFSFENTTIMKINDLKRYVNSVEDVSTLYRFGVRPYKSILFQNYKDFDGEKLK